jgi:hypothetical protein
MAARPRTRNIAARPRPRPKTRTCEPFCQVLVFALAPGLQPASINCTSTEDFLVYISTNYGPVLPPNWGYSVGVKSTGAGMGSQAPSFIVGGVAKDVISITMAPGVTSFITLQTRCDAKAGFEVPKN